MRTLALVVAALAGAGRAAPPEGATIEGRVTGPDGKPVVDAAILLQSGKDEPRWPGSIAQAGGHFAVVTDAQGRYRVDDVAAGRWYVAAVAHGFAVGEYGLASGWRRRFPLDLEAGDRVSGIDVVAPWRWDLKGRCVDADGKPVAEISVFMLFERADGTTVGHAEVLSDASGRFESGPVPIGRGGPVTGPVRAELSAPSWCEHRFEDRVVGPIDATPGAVHDSGDWRALRPCSLHGVVVRRDGRPLHEALVGIFLQEAEVDAQGAFRFERLQPGPAFLRVLPGGFGSATTPGPTLDLAPGANVGPIRLVVEPPRTISGRVVDERGEPFDDAEVRAFPAAGGWIPDEELPRVSSRADGRFELRGVPPGEWIVVVDHHSPQKQSDAPKGTTARVQAGADDVELVLARPWTLRYGATGLPDGVRPDIRTHTLVNGRHWLSLTWENGGEIFRFRDPVPLEVQIMFGDRARWFASVAAPERGATVDLGDFEPPYPAASRFEGIVVDTEGKPVRYPRVHAFHLATGVLVDELDDARYGDMKGRFAIERLPAGEYALLAITPGHSHALAARVTLGEETTKKMRLQCRSAKPFVLRVLDPDGKPLERARIEYRVDGFPYWLERDYRTYEPRSHGHDWTDADGWLRRPLMPAGGLDVKVRADGYAPRSLRLEPDDARSLVVRLAK